ncbi:hypothetical protein [Dickeya oryzae]|uniref:MotA/TolQ/ExbB proton channel domain-containing protein n=1 Tax=Dickeya oryzae TaxID=1240404 RepID=A0AB39IU41_9GAMM|nr:hypothetical protein [Dickeya oryzae]MCA6990235.1 hypothetical protein [Dickeya oryzae]
MTTIHPYDTVFFIGLIIISTIFFHIKFTDKNANEAPGILITIGICATFFGITMGLLAFDINDVEKSLPDLINGIKTAFWASVTGVFFALTIKFRYTFWGAKAHAADAPVQDATIDDIIRQLQLSGKALDKLHYSLVGNEEASLLTQLKLIRSDQNDQLGHLHKAFVEFAKTQAENNSNTLIDALKVVIRDFNEKISDQFGENFKQLNAAVGKINDWQEQYRQQMQEMIAQQTQTAANMQKASESFSQVVEHSESFSQTATNIERTIGAFSVLEQALEANLSELAHVIDVTKSGIPEIERRVADMITHIQHGAQTSANLITEHLLSTTQTLQSSVGHFTAQMTLSADNMARSASEQNAKTSEIIQKAGSELHQLMTSMSQEMTQYIQRHNGLITENISQMSDKTAQQVTALDAALSDALKKSLDSLGQQLASLSSKFTQDYTPLTERLKEVVRLSEALRA